MINRKERNERDGQTSSQTEKYWWKKQAKERDYDSAKSSPGVAYSLREYVRTRDCESYHCGLFRPRLPNGSQEEKGEEKS